MSNMISEFIVDAHSYYTTMKCDLNSYNTHILRNITIEYHNGDKEKCQLVICNNRVSYDTVSSMVGDITKDMDWDGICPKCKEKWIRIQGAC
ncbi:MAG: hypothetical protein V3V19_11405 [Cocleimonas sp.]